MVLHLPGLQNFFFLQRNKERILYTLGFLKQCGADKPCSLPFPVPTGHRGQWRCLRQLVGWCCWLGLPMLLLPATGISKELCSSCHHTVITKCSPLPCNKPRTCSKHQKSSSRPTQQEINCSNFVATSKSPGQLQEAESMAERGKKKSPKIPSQPASEK